MTKKTYNSLPKQDIKQQQKSKFQVDYLQEFVGLLIEFINNPLVRGNIDRIKEIDQLLEQKLVNEELAGYMRSLNDTTQKSISLLTLLEKEHIDEKHIC